MQKSKRCGATLTHEVALYPPSIVRYREGARLPLQTVAICDQLRAVDKRKIDRMIGAVTDAELALIEASVKAVFGLK
jgi:mRNA-degrading endonuclease toxin of MazEF toxin-antitoxin module